MPTQVSPIPTARTPFVDARVPRQNEASSLSRNLGEDDVCGDLDLFCSITSSSTLPVGAGMAGGCMLTTDRLSGTSRTQSLTSEYT